MAPESMDEDDTVTVVGLIPRASKWHCVLFAYVL